MPYTAPRPTPPALPASSVCARSTCDDPAAVVVGRLEGEEPTSVLLSRLCATHARDAVDDLLRRACLGLEAPALSLAPIGA